MEKNDNKAALNLMLEENRYQEEEEEEEERLSQEFARRLQEQEDEQELYDNKVNEERMHIENYRKQKYDVDKNKKHASRNPKDIAKKAVRFLKKSPRGHNDKFS